MICWNKNVLLTVPIVLTNPKVPNSLKAPTMPIVATFLKAPTLPNSFKVPTIPIVPTIFKVHTIPGNIYGKQVIKNIYFQKIV